MPESFLVPAILILAVLCLCGSVVKLTLWVTVGWVLSYVPSYICWAARLPVAAARRRAAGLASWRLSGMFFVVF